MSPSPSMRSFRNVPQAPFIEEEGAKLMVFRGRIGSVQMDQDIRPI
jgi:hypothetical protein